MGDLVRACAEHPLAACLLGVVVTFWMAFIFAQFRDNIFRVHFFVTHLPGNEEGPRE